MTQLATKRLVRESDLSDPTTPAGVALASTIAQTVGISGHRFTPEKYGAVADGIADDTAAVQSAIDAAYAYAVSSGTFYAEIAFRPRNYRIAGTYKTGSPTYGNSQLTLPVHPQAQNKVTLAFVGARDASALPMWDATANQRSGTVLRSTGAGGTYSGSTGAPAVIGGPNTEQGYGSTQNLWTNLLVYWDGISIVVPSPANQGGMQFRAVAQVVIGSASVFADAHPAGLTGGATGGVYAFPTNDAAAGLQMPETNNNDNSWIGNYSCEGMATGLFLGEHTVVENCRMIYCKTAIFVMSTAHSALVKAVSIEWCVNGIDYANGYADVLFADFEDGGGVWAPIARLLNVTNAIGSFRYNNNVRDSLLTLMPTGELAASGVRVFDTRLKAGYRSDTPAVPTSTTPLFNPFYRDAMVTISGGTVTAITIDGQATGLTSGSFLVPTCKTIAVTYSSAPTWRWYLTGATM